MRIVNLKWFLLFMASALVLAGCSERTRSTTNQSSDGLAIEANRSVGQKHQRGENRQSVPTDGTKRMALILKDLPSKADPINNPTIGPKALLGQLREKLSGESQRKQQTVLRSRIGFQLLVDGQTQSALEHFQLVRQNLDALALPENHEYFRTLQELLGLAYLRLGEQENCITNHTAESCIIPIRGGGVHQIPEGAMAARREFMEGLKEEPGDLRNIWLLNLTYMVLGEYPDKVPQKWLIPPAVFESDYDMGRFRNVATEAGVDTIGLSGGVVVDDFDSDGLLDILASDWGIDKQLRLYSNNGDGSFTETTAQAGLEGEVGGLNLVQADYDNDGHVDVLVLRGAWLGNAGQHPNSLLRNLGDGRFDDVTEKAGLLSFCPTQTACWADYDLDGRIDLFVGNETFRSKDCPCQLYHNNGDGTFTDVALEVGLAHLGRVKGVAWGDVDNDGYPDLYLSRYGQSNILYHNDGPTDWGWRFRDVTDRANVERPVESFPTWFWDYDNDGWIDILVAPFSGFKFDGTALRTVVSEYLGRPTSADRIHLYRNNRDGTFSEVAGRLGLDVPLLAMGSNFGDLDNDGYLDCYLGTGDPHIATLVPNRMFRNDRGRGFQDVTTSGGFGHIQKGHGVGFGDLDNDGDQDIYAVMGGAYAGDVYQNVLFENPGHDNHWITLRLIGVSSNRSAIGARIKITVRTPTDNRDIHSTVSSGGSFGASSLQQEIGLGDALAIENIEIHWPTKDSIQRFTDVPRDRVYEIREGNATFIPVDVRQFKFSTTGVD